MLSANERRDFIYRHIHENQIAYYDELASLMNVSHMTIRSDTTLLEREGKVLRVNGGVRLSEFLHQELPWQEKSYLNHKIKKELGQCAMRRIAEGTIIYLLAALDAGSRVGMIATFRPAIAGMEKEFSDMAARLGKTVSLKTVCAEGAIEALHASDDETHHRLVAEYAQQLTGCDAIMLAHFSTSRALKAVQAVTRVPVLAAPQSAVSEMKQRVLHNEGKTSC